MRVSMIICCASVIVCELKALKEGLIFDQLWSIGIVDICLALVVIGGCNI